MNIFKLMLNVPTPQFAHNCVQNEFYIYKMLNCLHFKAKHVIIVDMSTKMAYAIM